MTYDHESIEKNAREKWRELGLYVSDLSDESKEPYYLLVEFPYPSGDLHIGHWYAFAVTDIYARLLRARGKNVLFPMGFDAFGLPAENAAIRNKIDPAAWTRANIDRMKGQVEAMGASFDWSKEVVTADPSYYHWTQWLFAKLFEHGLAERREAAVKWCPHDMTVLANEQVINGRCERCGTEVEERMLTQWFLRITDYAERLLKNLDTLPWREDIKDAQRAWIGQSEGAQLFFNIRFKKTPPANEWRDEAGNPARIAVFTTRPDTLYGATYLVLAPEHPWLARALAEPGLIGNAKKVRAYVETTKKKTERERSENKVKTGVVLEGIAAINPATKEEIPLYVGDYVLGSYGMGAVMAVPAHDERDAAFAKKYKLPSRTVIEPVFTDTNPKSASALREGEEVIKREAVCAVVRNPKNSTYLCISWKNELMHGLVTGGIDAGESAVEAGRREVREETGFKHLKHVERPEIAINTFFYHRIKKQNRWAHFHIVFFDLENDEREAVGKEEDALHEVQWIKKKDLRKFFTVFEGNFIADILDAPKQFMFTGPGLLVNSGEWSGKKSAEAKWNIASAAGGERVTLYRLRDWLVSRQRYWGCPIPIVYDPSGTPHHIPAEHLPWMLPTDVDFTPTGKAPLASSKELQERVTTLFGEGWTPEYDTLDTFVDSSWYFTRYLDSHDGEKFADTRAMKRWLPVNRYSGGSEHTTMHLLYARFFTMALYDLSLMPVEEPFAERFNRGLIMGPDGQKMSKSKGNVVNPDEFVKKFGADAVRMYLAFIGPYNEPGSYPWQLDGVLSMRKFLERVIRLVERVAGNARITESLTRALARAATKISEDGDRFKFNTGLAAIMTLMNELEKTEIVPTEAARDLLVMLAPFAPHLTEHLWEKLGAHGTKEESVHQASWPAYDQGVLAVAEHTVVVQVAGKKRGELVLSQDTGEKDAVEAALALPAVASALGGKTPSRVVYIRGRILNLVP